MYYSNVPVRHSGQQLTAGAPPTKSETSSGTGYKYTSNFLYATTQVEHPYKCG